MPMPTLRHMFAVACIAGSALAASAGGVLQALAPGLTPEAVVEVQLAALQHNDRPYRDAGIEQTWALAHPDNRQVTGPLPRFAAMLRSPQYRALLDHHAHAIEALERGPAQVTFQVTIETRGGQAYGFAWTVEKIADGAARGCWATTLVSPPVPLGTTL